MIYQQAVHSTVTDDEYYVYPVNLREKLWLAWKLLLDSKKFRVAIRLTDGEKWVAKNCIPVPLDTRGLKTVD